MARRTGKKKQLTDAVKEQIREHRAKQQVSIEVEWTIQALEFLHSYAGENPILRSFVRQSRVDPSWVPTSRQAVQIHRIAHQERIETPSRDSLGRKLRAREGPDVPTSLDEPDWL